MSLRRALPLVLLAACSRSTPSSLESDGAPSRLAQSAEASISSWPAFASSDGGDVKAGGAAKPGMAWIPAGVLRAGTPRERSPRVADEEMPGVAVEMSGFYIDLLAWPNEPNAIPTTNVSRDEAEQLCGTKGKRLCTELEWERACKGPESTTYEYGETYRKDVCGTGIAIEQASRRPTGEHAQCRSAFGVAEMHGGVFEWTTSVWGRGSKDAAQGVLRGGNSVAGELAGRCANAIARNPSKKAPTMGFRCCAGTKNTAEVSLELRGTPGFTMVASAQAAPFASAVATATGGGSPAIDPKTLHAWSWIPSANEELLVARGCTVAPRACGLVVVRPAASDAGAGGEVLAALPSGKEPPDIARNGGPRHLRFRSLDPRGVYQRDITYAYGRIDVGESKRP